MGLLEHYDVRLSPLIMPAPSPVQPREFFSGIWTGEGEVRFLGPARWFRRPETFRYQTQVHWITESHSQFIDVFEFERGRRLEIPFVSEVVGARRLHVTSPDMPGGADILLSEQGYTYSPYVLLVRFGPFQVRLHCTDVNVVESDGVIHDRAEMKWLGLHIATLTMRIRVDRSDWNWQPLSTTTMFACWAEILGFPTQETVARLRHFQFG